MKCNKVLTNIEQNLTDTEKATARRNIGVVNGSNITFKPVPTNSFDAERVSFNSDNSGLQAGSIELTNDSMQVSTTLYTVARYTDNDVGKILTVTKNSRGITHTTWVENNKNIIDNTYNDITWPENTTSDTRESVVVLGVSAGNILDFNLMGNMQGVGTSTDRDGLIMYVFDDSDGSKVYEQWIYCQRACDDVLIKETPFSCRCILSNSTAASKTYTLKLANMQGRGIGKPFYARNLHIVGVYS